MVEAARGDQALVTCGGSIRSFSIAAAGRSAADRGATQAVGAKTAVGAAGGVGGALGAEAAEEVAPATVGECER